MENNPYKSPDSDLVTKKSFLAPEKIEKKIKTGWIFACVSGFLTLVATSYSLYAGELVNYINAWNFLDVALVFILAYGIYRKNRTAATIMLLYFVASKIDMYLKTNSIANPLLAIIFCFVFLQAMIGTFQYHKLKNDS